MRLLQARRLALVALLVTLLSLPAHSGNGWYAVDSTNEAFKFGVN